MTARITIGIKMKPFLQFNCSVQQVLKARDLLLRLHRLFPSEICKKSFTSFTSSIEFKTKNLTAHSNTDELTCPSEQKTEVHTYFMCMHLLKYGARRDIYIIVASLAFG